MACLQPIHPLYITQYPNMSRPSPSYDHHPLQQDNSNHKPGTVLMGSLRPLASKDTWPANTQPSEAS